MTNGVCYCQTLLFSETTKQVIKNLLFTKIFFVIRSGIITMQLCYCIKVHSHFDGSMIITSILHAPVYMENACISSVFVLIVDHGVDTAGFCMNSLLDASIT